MKNVKKAYGLTPASMTIWNDDQSYAPQKMEKYLTWLLDNGAQTISVCGSTGENLAMNMEEQRAIIDRPDSLPLLPAIAVPTLIGVGEDDRMTLPEESRLLHERIPGARLHVFARCGHLPPMEVPQETTAVLRDWLQAS